MRPLFCAKNPEPASGRKISERPGLDEFMELDKGEGRNEREQTGPD